MKGNQPSMRDNLSSELNDEWGCLFNSLDDLMPDEIGNELEALLDLTIEYLITKKV